jgi:hypothetical protein
MARLKPVSLSLFLAAAPLACVDPIDPPAEGEGEGEVIPTEGEGEGEPAEGEGEGELSAAALVAERLGLEPNFLIGAKHNMAGVAELEAPMDLRYVYLVGDGTDSWGWPYWNDPPGRYVDLSAEQMDAEGSVPMFTLYSMAAWGDGYLGGLDDAGYMSDYWAEAKLMYERLALFDKPAIVHLEPDFWGYATQQSGGDPSTVTVQVSAHAPDCADLPDDLEGMGRCLVRLGRTYAPKAVISFGLSKWAASTPEAHASFMVAVGAAEADLFVVEPLDRDAGCFEAQALGCTRQDGPWYWDETNQTSPNFREHLEWVEGYASILDLPVLWWQTPMGVPGDTPGTDGRFRDNRVRYIFDHPEEFTAIGGLGVLFGEGGNASTGTANQTTPATDDGQFANALEAYNANPQPLD